MIALVSNLSLSIASSNCRLYSPTRTLTLQKRWQATQRHSARQGATRSIPAVRSLLPDIKRTCKRPGIVPGPGQWLIIRVPQCLLRPKGASITTWLHLLIPINPFGTFFQIMPYYATITIPSPLQRIRPGCSWCLQLPFRSSELQSIPSGLSAVSWNGIPMHVAKDVKALSLSLSPSLLPQHKGSFADQVSRV